MIPDAGGTYALLLSCTGAGRIRIGRLGTLHLRPGWYIYIGSAFGPGGLRARISHHQHVAERPHWHIDYLRRNTSLDAVWYKPGARCEHEWAEALAAMACLSPPLAGFGSSDCKCLAHLFWFGGRPQRTKLPSERAPITKARSAKRS